MVTGIISYKELDKAQPLAYALTKNSSNIGSAIVATGGLCGMSTVIMMQLYGQSRIAYVMSRDGLYPHNFAKLHPKYDSPYFSLIFFASISATLTAFVPYDNLAKLSSMGSLVHYSAIAIAVMLFRVTRPEAKRPFKCPAIFIVAPIALFSSLFMLSKQIMRNGELIITGQLIIGWISLVTILYFLSRLIRKNHAKAIL